MKTNQITVMAITAVLLFILAGCDNTDGKLALKEPRQELKGDGMRWTINGPVDEAGNLIVPEETD